MIARPARLDASEGPVGPWNLRPDKTEMHLPRFLPMAGVLPLSLTWHALTTLAPRAWFSRTTKKKDRSEQSRRPHTACPPGIVDVIEGNAR